MGGASSNQAAHALLGALSFLGVAGMWMLWLVWGSLNESLWDYWLAATSAMLTLCLAGSLYFFGFHWEAVLASVAFAPLIGGAAVLRVVAWRWLPNSKSDQITKP
jgi:hypothetical protein